MTDCSYSLRRSPNCLWLLFVMFFAPWVQSDPVDDYVAAQMDFFHLPGVAVAVTRSGSVIKLAGYGLANVEHEIPVTPSTVFQIQSVTKQFVATAIMMLVQEGKVSLDAKVSAYLEGAPEIWDKITIRHLLSHTSGIKDFINEPTASLRLEVTDEGVFEATAVRPLNFQPGEKYAYSNTNYHLLAMIIRKVTGESYGAFLQRRVFQPLGMSHTRVVSWADIIPHRAAGYGWRTNHLVNGEFVAGSILAYGGGGLLSTAEDMAKWDLGLRAAQILARQALEQMWSATRLNDGTSSGYGFGWGVGGQVPHRFVQHTGGHITGFTSAILRYLDDDLSVIVLVNAGFANPSKMSRTIAEFYVTDLRAPEGKPIEDKEPEVTELLRRLEGMVRGRRLESNVFTPLMREAVAASLQESAGILDASGSLKRLELLEHTALTDGARQYRYRMRFERASALITLLLDREGKVSGLTTEIE